MKVTSRQTYKIIRTALEMKKFTQYALSKKTKVTFSLVNRVVNWLVSIGYAAKRKKGYEIAAAAAIFSLFPLNRKMKPCAVFDVNLSRKSTLKMVKGKGMLCLASALSYYDDYYRDAGIYFYITDEKLLDELKNMPKGYTHIEVFREDLNKDDFVKTRGQAISSKVRTIIDLFCYNKAYTAERLIKREWS